MKTFASCVSALTLAFTLTACGGDDGGSSSDFTEADLRDQLTELGFTGDLADCVIDETKKQAGSIDEYTELSTDEQYDMSAKAGATCAQDANPDDIAGAVAGAEELGVDLSDPQVRESFITGMTQSGAPEELANCIVDAAIDQDLTLSELIKPEVIQPLAQECAA